MMRQVRLRLLVLFLTSFALAHLGAASSLVGEDPITAELIAQLRQQDESTASIVQLLGEIGDPCAVPMLVNCLGEEDRPLALSAAGSLAAIGGDRAAEALTDAAFDKKSKWTGGLMGGMVVAGYLVKVLEPAAAPRLLAVLRDGPKGKRALAIQVLGGLRATAAAPAIWERLGADTTSERWDLSGLTSELERPEILAAIEDIADERLAPAIMEAARQNNATEYRLDCLRLAGALGVKGTEDILTEAMRSDSPPIRLAAVQGAGRMKGRVMRKALMEAMKDPDPRVASEAMAALAWMWDQDVATSLIRILQSGAPRLVTSACEVLRDANEPRAVAILMGIAEGRDPNLQAGLQAMQLAPTIGLAVEGKIRCEAALTLAALGSAKAEPVLLSIAQDESWPDRASAMKALGRIKSRKAIPLLAAIVKTPGEDSSLAWAAIDALGEIGDPNCTAALIEAMAAHPRAAVRALWRIGDPSAAAALGRRLADTKLEFLERREAARAFAACASAQQKQHLVSMLGNKAWEDRATAVIGLGGNAPAGSFAAVAGLLNSPGAIERMAAAESLGSSRNKAAVAGLTRAAKDRCSGVRAMAVWALGEIGSTECGLAIRESLRDPNWLVRAAAARAMRTVRGSFAVPDLLECLKDHRQEVMFAAIESLSELGTDSSREAMEQLASDASFPVREAARRILVRLRAAGRL